MSNTPSKAEIEVLVKRHGATSYRNRADTQHPAYGFTEDGLNGLIDEVLAKWAAPQQEAQEPFAWESTTPGYIKYITQARYEKFSPAVRRWYKPYRCSGCAERGAGFDACDMATAAAQGFRSGQAAAKQEE